MASVVYQFLGSLLGGGVAVAVLGFLGREWLVLRLKDAIDREALLRRTVLEVKRDACLEALSVVDATFSHRQWTVEGKAVAVTPQPLEISRARSCHNRLALTCDNVMVVDCFMQTLGFTSSSNTIPKSPTDSMIELRNAMRKELGFGQPLDLDREKAWIGTLGGAEAA